MISYWLSCPALILIFIFTFSFFPNSNWALGSTFFKRFSPYLKNLSSFCWIFLALALFFNTILTLFYLVDIVAVGNVEKYSVYWESGGSKRPLSVFLSIIAYGSLLYWFLAYICYRKFWRKVPVIPLLYSSNFSKDVNSSR